MKFYGNGVSAGIATGRIYSYSPFIPHIEVREISPEASRHSQGRFQRRLLPHRPQPPPVDR